MYIHPSLFGFQEFKDLKQEHPRIFFVYFLKALRSVNLPQQTLFLERNNHTDIACGNQKIGKSFTKFPNLVSDHAAVVLDKS